MATETTETNSPSYSYDELKDKLDGLSESFAEIKQNVAKFKELSTDFSAYLNAKITGNCRVTYTQVKDNDQRVTTTVDIDSDIFSEQIYDFFNSLVNKCQERIENENRKVQELKKYTADFVNKDFDIDG